MRPKGTSDEKEKNRKKKKKGKPRAVAAGPASFWPSGANCRPPVSTFAGTTVPSHTSSSHSNRARALSRTLPSVPSPPPYPRPDAQDAHDSQSRGPGVIYDARVRASAKWSNRIPRIVIIRLRSVYVLKKNECCSVFYGVFAGKNYYYEKYGRNIEEV